VEAGEEACAGSRGRREGEEDQGARKAAASGNEGAGNHDHIHLDRFSLQRGEEEEGGITAWTDTQAPRTPATAKVGGEERREKQKVASGQPYPEVATTMALDGRRGWGM
jgi:hypothetical protein